MSAYPATSKVTASFTRPADTNAYAASDVVCNSTSAPAVITFSNTQFFDARSGYITGARLIKSSAGVTNASFRLWLFSTAPTAINDNAQFTLLAANKLVRLGYIDFTLTTEGTGSDCAEGQAFNQNIAFECSGSSTSLFGVLEAKAAYTPVSAEIFTVELSVERN